MHTEMESYHSADALRLPTGTYANSLVQVIERVAACSDHLKANS